MQFDLTSEHGRSQAYAHSAEGAALVRSIEAAEENFNSKGIDDAEQETEDAKNAHANDLQHIGDALCLALNELTEDKSLTPAKFRDRISAIQAAIADAADDGISFFKAERRGLVRFPFHA